MTLEQAGWTRLKNDRSALHIEYTLCNKLLPELIAFDAIVEQSQTKPVKWGLGQKYISEIGGLSRENLQSQLESYELHPQNFWGMGWCIAAIEAIDQLQNLRIEPFVDKKTKKA